MVRLMSLLAALGLLSAAAGCHGDHAINQHGICDCVMDNYCATRAPWLGYTPAPAPMPPAEVVPAPTKVAPGKGL